MPLIPAFKGRDRWISVSLRPAWSTDRVPGLPRLHREILSQKEEGGRKKKKEGKKGRRKKKNAYSKGTDSDGVVDPWELGITTK